MTSLSEQNGELSRKSSGVGVEVKGAGQSSTVPTMTVGRCGPRKLRPAVPALSRLWAPAVVFTVSTFKVILDPQEATKSEVLVCPSPRSPGVTSESTTARCHNPDSEGGTRL